MFTPANRTLLATRTPSPIDVRPRISPPILTAHDYSRPGTSACHSEAACRPGRRSEESLFLPTPQDDDNEAVRTPYRDRKTEPRSSPLFVPPFPKPSFFLDTNRYRRYLTRDYVPFRTLGWVLPITIHKAPAEPLRIIVYSNVPSSGSGEVLRPKFQINFHT
jgi:hypothetical protein